MYPTPAYVFHITKPTIDLECEVEVGVVVRLVAEVAGGPGERVSLGPAPHCQGVPRTGWHVQHEAVQHYGHHRVQEQHYLVLSNLICDDPWGNVKENFLLQMVDSIITERV